MIASLLVALAGAAKCGENATPPAYEDASLDGTIAMRRERGYDGVAYIGPMTVAMPPEP